MKEEKQNKEYRSEKVQAILGEIPASLEHFGFIAIGAVILCILSIFYFTPYKQIYSGTVVIHGVKSFEPSDSTETDILLHFEKTRPKNVEGQLLYLQSPNGKFAGRILQLSTTRDTLDRYNAVCRFKTIEIKLVENQTVDFQIVFTFGNLLQEFLNRTI